MKFFESEKIEMIQAIGGARARFKFDAINKLLFSFYIRRSEIYFGINYI